MTAIPTRSRFDVRCVPCGAVFTVADLPMPVKRFVEIALNARPYCGAGLDQQTAADGVDPHPPTREPAS